jgi:hypothetical protein
MKIGLADFTQIENTLKTIHNMAFRLNGELGYVHTRDPSPFEQKLDVALKTLYKYAPDEFFVDIALDILKDKLSESRAANTLINKYGVDEERATRLTKAAWDKFLYDEGEMY